jgi:hypothetical protein
MYAHTPGIGREIRFLIALHLSVPGSLLLAPLVLVCASTGVNTVFVKYRHWHMFLSPKRWHFFFNLVMKCYETFLSFIVNLLFHYRLRQQPKLGLRWSPKDHNYNASLPKYVLVSDLFAVFFFGICFLFNLLKPSGFFTYHQVSYLKILHGARFALSVLYGSQNRQQPLLYTSWADWFLKNRGGKCLQRGTDWFLL